MNSTGNCVGNRSGKSSNSKDNNDNNDIKLFDKRAELNEIGLSLLPSSQPRQSNILAENKFSFGSRDDPNISFAAIHIFLLSL